MSEEEVLLVRCISIRAAYGGMAGDVTMLRAFATTWTARSAIVSKNQRASSGLYFDDSIPHEVHHLCSRSPSGKR